MEQIRLRFFDWILLISIEFHVVKFSIEQDRSVRHTVYCIVPRAREVQRNSIDWLQKGPIQRNSFDWLQKGPKELQYGTLDVI